MCMRIYTYTHVYIHKSISIHIYIYIYIYIRIYIYTQLLVQIYTTPHDKTIKNITVYMYICSEGLTRRSATSGLANFSSKFDVFPMFSSILSTKNHKSHRFPSISIILHRKKISKKTTFFKKTYFFIKP